MFRTEYNRVDPKRRHADFRKRQHVEPAFKEEQYPHRLNFYATPPTADITLEQFEQWAIDRLRGVSPPDNLGNSHIFAAIADAQPSF